MEKRHQMRRSSFFSRVPDAALILVGLTLYFLIGWPLLGLAYPDLSEAPARLFALVLPLPIFAFMGAWVFAERRMGRRIMERLPADPIPKSDAQRRTERRATILIISVASFVSAIPISMHLLKGEMPGLGEVAPGLVWAWIFYTLGWVRMRQGTILTIQPKGLTPEELDKRADRLLLGLALEQRKTKANIWKGRIDCSTRDGVPFVSASVYSVPGPDDEFEQEVFEMDPSDEPAFMTALTEDANRYKLFFYGGRQAEFDLTELSHHACMMGMTEVHAGRARAKELISG